jgi:hypothetical protein
VITSARLRARQSHQIRTLTTVILEYELRAYTQQRNNWTDRNYDHLVDSGPILHSALPHCTSAAIKMKPFFCLLSRPAQLSVLAYQLATVALMDLCATAKSAEFYLLPACRVYLRDSTVYIISTLTTELLRAYIQKRNDRANHKFDPIS